MRYRKLHVTEGQQTLPGTYYVLSLDLPDGAITEWRTFIADKIYDRLRYPRDHLAMTLREGRQQLLMSRAILLATPKQRR